VTQSGSNEPLLPHLDLPEHHDVRASDVDARRLYANLAAAADRGPKEKRAGSAKRYEAPCTTSATMAKARTVRAPTPGVSRRSGKSFAHGGKDGHPFPVPLRVYDETIRVMKSAVQNAKLGLEEELGALKRPDQQARLLEQCAYGRPLEELIVEERRRSHSYEGRSVFGWARAATTSGEISSGERGDDSQPIVIEPTQ
jgi:hypothetical protein